jgi:5-methylcytosine-specific restriction endonuclease McrA
MLDTNPGLESLPEGFRLALCEGHLQAAKVMLADNEGALFSVLHAVDLQIVGGSAELRDDFVRILLERDDVSPSIISNAFCLSGRELWEIYAADPKSLFGCLNCSEPLQVRGIRDLKRVKRALKAICGCRAGNLVHADLLCILLCERCTGAQLQAHNDECRMSRRVHQARVARVKKMPFSEYRLTEDWQAKRAFALARAGFRCQVCAASDTRLDVHHNSYERYGEESVFDLVVLCERCHELFHEHLDDAA